MNRARRSDESYEDYHANLQAEERAFRLRCRGNFVPSTGSLPRRVVRKEINRRGRKFREQVRQLREGAKRRVESHRKMGG